MNRSLQGPKVVSAKEMARLEAALFPSEKKQEEWMNLAGKNVAEAVDRFCLERGIKIVCALVGKGNNGGDAFVCCRHLVEKGYAVKAFCLADLDACSPLCRMQGKRFVKAGGDVHFLESLYDLIFPEKAVILDGIFGTGFTGALEGLAQHAVEKANASLLPILAIDIPSGLNGSTGEVESSAIKAEKTFYLGLPKIGFFLGKGYNHVGKLVQIDFGLKEEEIAKADPLAYLVDEKALGSSLPPIVRSRHKYQRGYVVGIAGSKGMGGAAKLSSLAALRAGAGIVRLFCAEDAADEMMDAPFEIIRGEFSREKMPEILEKSSKANALFIGPGMGRGVEAEDFFRAFLPKWEKPAVLDADALFLLAKHLSLKLPKEAVLTPHRQEMLRLLGENAVQNEWGFLEKCRAFSKERQVSLVLKGAPTFVYLRGSIPFIIPRGDPGMATAGSGDVLTGIVAALFAQGLDSYHASLLGVYLHALSGEIAAKELTSYAVIASDLISHLPQAFKRLQE